MYSLFIDTHSNSVIIVLFKNDKVLISKEIMANFDHSISTMPLLIETLKEGKITVNDLNEIIIVNGPGSFTGVRIGVTIAKTLAYTLNIPIKVLSSLDIKAISFEHEDIYIVEREKNGVFIGKYDKSNNLIEGYKYLKKLEFESISDKSEYIEDIKIDYNKIITYLKDISPTNPHIVNPLYIKTIEVQND